MNTLHDIEHQCTRLATARSLLNSRLVALKSELDAVRRAHRASIRKSLEKVQALTEETRELVSGAPDLFQKPKSVELAGIKVGFQQSKSKLEIADAEKTCALIRRHLPESADTYIQIEERPIRAALAQLPAAMQRRIGVSQIDGIDEPIVRPQDGDLEALCKTLLGE